MGCTSGTEMLYLLLAALQSNTAWQHRKKGTTKPDYQSTGQVDRTGTETGLAFQYHTLPLQRTQCGECALHHPLKKKNLCACLSRGSACLNGVYGVGVGWGAIGDGWLGQSVSALVLPPVCTLWNTTFITHFKDWSPPMEALESRPEAAWTPQTTGCPYGWVAVLIFVMNVYVNILGENGNRQEMEGTGRSHPGVSCIFWWNFKVLIGSLFSLESSVCQISVLLNFLRTNAGKLANLNVP